MFFFGFLLNFSSCLNFSKLFLAPMRPSWLPRRDYYALLGVARSAGTREIRSGYQWAASKWHPQKNPGKAETQSRFRDIAEAYDAPRRHMRVRGVDI